MCGIAGIIHFDGKPVLRSDLKRMTDAIAHRGPDGEGFFVEGNVGFGHRRLAIIDLTDAGAQPMTRFGYTITYNGEIYNYLELKQELIKLGYDFLSHSDTEVILAAYHCWGKNCVTRFNGMWAFAIYDAASQEVFLSRDRFGKKPLYFTRSHLQFFFCSEIKGVLALNTSRPKPDYEAVCTFIVTGAVDYSKKTFFQGVEKLPAAHSAILNLIDCSFSTICYYSLSQVSDRVNMDELSVVENFREQFHRAVRWRLRSDVGIGISLSGGLDSSYLAATIARSNPRQDVKAFTGGSLNALEDESSKAMSVANRFRMPWYQAIAGIASFHEAFEKVVFAQEEPFDSPSVFMQYFVMQKAKETGIKVILGGQGADEILLGYLRHIHPWLQSMPWMNRIGIFGKLAHNNAISLSEMLKLYFYFSSQFLKQKRQMLIWPSIRRPVVDQYVNFGPQNNNLSLAHNNLFEFQRDEVMVYSLPKMLRYEDKNAMAFGLESRLPYLDYEVVEAALNAPDQLKMKGGWTKYLLRRAMEVEFPKEFVESRQKIGFNAPVSIWMSDESCFSSLVADSHLIQSLFLKAPKIPNTSQANWRLISIAAWEKAFEVESDKNAVEQYSS